MAGEPSVSTISSLILLSPMMCHVMKRDADAVYMSAWRSDNHFSSDGSGWQKQATSTNGAPSRKTVLTTDLPSATQKSTFLTDRFTEHGITPLF